MTSPTIFGESLLDPTRPAEEKDLVVPMLLVMAQADRSGQAPLSTFQIHEALKDSFEMSDKDEEVVRREKVTRFRRTIDNVIAHDLLTRDGLAKKEPREQGGYNWSITPRGRAYLLDFMLEPKDPLPDGEMRVLSTGERLLENVVAFYMLVRLAELQKDNKKAVPIPQLRKDIKSSLPLSVQDLAPLKNRTDTKIDQIVRNIISHNTLTKNGWATRTEKGLVITVKGKGHVLDHLLDVFPPIDFVAITKAEEDFRQQVNERRAQVAAEAAAKRKQKQKP